MGVCLEWVSTEKEEEVSAGKERVSVGVSLGKEFGCW